MPFPSSPVNGQTIVANNITYSYNSTLQAWTRVATLITATNSLVITGNISASSTNTGALQVMGGVGISGTLYVGSLRGDSTPAATTYAIYYNPTTKELTTSTVTGGTAGSFTGGTVTGVTTFTNKVVVNNLVQTNLPLILNDISNQTDGKRNVFALKVDQTAVSGIVDNKDLEVIVNGRRLAPYVTEKTYPWISTYRSGRGFQVVTTGSSAQSIVIFNSPDIGSEVIITQLNTSASKQIRKYPYSAATIALGD